MVAHSPLWGCGSLYPKGWSRYISLGSFTRRSPQLQGLVCVSPQTHHPRAQPRGPDMEGLSTQPFSTALASRGYCSLSEAAAPSSLWCHLLSNPPPSAGDQVSIGNATEIVFAPWLQSERAWDLVPCSFLLFGPVDQCSRRWFVSGWIADCGPVGSPCAGRPMLIAELGLMHGVAKMDWQICREQLSCIPYVAWLPLGDLKRGEKIFCWKRVRVFVYLAIFKHLFSPSLAWPHVVKKEKRYQLVLLEACTDVLSKYRFLWP